MGKRGNITGESFDVEVIKQIEARQTFMGVNPKLDKHLLYQNNKTAFVRLASSINIESNNLLSNQTSNLFGLQTPPTLSIFDQETSTPQDFLTEESTKPLQDRNLPTFLQGKSLAEECVLFGGTVSVNTDDKTFAQKYGVGEGDNSPKGYGTENIDLSSTSVYGWGGLGEQGYRPMPGILDANISYYNRGALAKATVNCKVYSVEQLQIFDLLYLRIGYTMLLEWGHNIYIDNTIRDNQWDPNLVNRPTFYTKPFNKFFDNKSTQNDIIDSIKEQRKDDYYNYDAMLGKVVNFTWKYNNDGSYNITLNLVGLGDVIEALKINTSVAGNTGAKPSDLLNEEEIKARELEAEIERIEGQVTAAENAVVSAQAALDEVSDSTDLLTATVETFITRVGKLSLDTALSTATVTKIYSQGKLDTTGAIIDDNVAGSAFRNITLGAVNAGLSALVQSKGGSSGQVSLLAGLKNPLPKINDSLLLQYIDKKDFVNSDKLINQLFADIESSSSDFQTSIRRIIFKALNPGLYSKESQIIIDLFNGGKPVSLSKKTGPGAVTASEYSRLLTIESNRVKISAGVTPLDTTKKPLDYSYSEIKSELLKIYNKVKEEGNQKNELAKNAAGALARATATKQAAQRRLKQAQQELALLKEKFENFPQSAAEYRDKSNFNRQLYLWIEYIKNSANKTTGEIKETIELNDIQKQVIERTLKDQGFTKEQITEEFKKFTGEQLNNIKNPDFCKLNFQAVSHDASTGRSTFDITQYYVRFGYMLDWMTYNLLIYDDSKKFDIPQITTPISGSTPGMTASKGHPYLTIDTDVEANILKHFPSQISSDPKICIIPINYTKQFKGKKSNTVTDSKTKKQTTTIEDFEANFNWISLNGTNPNQPNLKNYFIEGEKDAARLMNIMVNIDFVADTLAQNVDPNGKVTLLSFLNSVCMYISDTLGGVNKLNTVYDGDSNQIKIVDENGIGLSFNKVEVKKAEPVIPEIGRFRAYGLQPSTQGSFLNDIDFQVQLPPNMASMATISAQSSGNIVGENATGLSKLNTGLKDRIIPSKLDSQSIKAKSNNNTTTDPNVIFGDKINQMNTFVEDIYENNKYDPQNIESLKSINRDVSLFEVGIKAEKEEIPAPFFIPFNLSLTMDGLSGMKNYERFSITEEILPYSYRSSDALEGGVIDFLIKGISHTVSNNQWKTKLESLTVSSIRRPKK